MLMKKSIPIFLLLLIQTAVQGENSTFYYNKGVEFFKAGNMLEAENNFKLSVKANPSYTLGHYGLGRIYILQSEKIKDAVNHLKSSVSLDPDFAMGWFKLGLAELIAGKYIDALHSFDNAYKKDETLIESLYNMGVVYDLIGDEFKALTYYRLYYKKVKGEGSIQF